MKDYYGVIKFGRYPQGENGEIEDIEWLILDRQDGYMLLVSKYILDFIPTNKKRTKVTWETCTLRKWLNEDFLNFAFNESEKARIADATLEPDTSMSNLLVTCNETEDKIALMSNKECYTYFTSDKTRMCETTQYAALQRTKKCKPNMQIENLCNSWLVRIDGPYLNEADFVFSFGKVCEFGNSVSEAGGIRPAMFVEIDKNDVIYDENDCVVINADEMYIKNNILTKYEGDGAEVVVPYGVSDIGEKAFQSNEKMEKVVLPEGIISICNKAFDGCAKLSSINVPDGVKTIGIQAFSCCYALMDIVLPKGIEKIDESAFYFCKALKKVVLPNGVIDIDEKAFELCNELTIYAPEGSYAEAYAKNNNIPFISVGKSSIDCVVKSEMKRQENDESERFRNIQITIEDVCKLWSYITSTCDEEDIKSMVEEFNFDMVRLNESNLKNISSSELFGLYADVVYMILNDIGNGDFETMRDILVENLGLDSETVDMILDF